MTNDLAVLRILDVVIKFIAALVAAWGMVKNLCPRQRWLHSVKRRPLSIITTFTIGVLAIFSLLYVSLGVNFAEIFDGGGRIKRERVIFSSEKNSIRGITYWPNSSIEVLPEASLLDQEDDDSAKIRGYSFTSNNVVWINNSEREEGALPVQKKQIEGKYPYPILIEWENPQNNLWCSVYIGGGEGGEPTTIYEFPRYKIDIEDTIIVETFVQGPMHIDGNIFVFLDGPKIQTSPEDRGYLLNCTPGKHETPIPASTLLRNDAGVQSKQIYEIDKVIFRLTGRNGVVYITKIGII